MTKAYFLPLTAKAKTDVIDHIFDNVHQYVGFAIKPSFLINHIAYLTNNEAMDVLATLEQMVADNQLVETGFYYPDKLYSVNPDLL